MPSHQLLTGVRKGGGGGGLIVVLLIMVASLFIGIESANPPPDCDLSNTKDEIQKFSINSDVNIPYQYISLVNNPVNTKLTKDIECQWKILLNVENTFLELASIILSPKDTILVEGFNVEKNKTSNQTLFTSSGSVMSSLISTNSFEYVILSLHISKDFNDERSFLSVIYWQSHSIYLNHDMGSLLFPVNINNRSLTTKFTFKPALVHIDRVILIQFVQLPKNYNFLLNDVNYSSSLNKPPPSIYLQKGDGLSFVLTSLLPSTSNGEFQIRYWLVSKSCSDTFSMSNTGEYPLLYPNETVRAQQKLTSVRCAQYFVPNPEFSKSRIELLIDPTTTSLANPGDSINFFRNGNELELTLNTPNLEYFSSIPNYLAGNRYLVIYDSPYMGNKPNNEVKMPRLKLFTEGGTYVVSIAQPLNVMVPDSSDAKNKVVHLIYPERSSKPSQKIVLEFGTNVVVEKPGTWSISVYNTDHQSAKPIVVLGQFAQLPLAVASDTSIMRVVYEGPIPKKLDVTYKLVDENESCQHLATFVPNFEVIGSTDKRTCSWYVPPQPANQYTVINPTVVKLPVGVKLEVVIFNLTNVYSQTYAGPLNEYYLPDFFLNSSAAYEYRLVTTGIVDASQLHLLIAKKSVYANQTTLFTDAITQNISSISSPNYPGLYPLGVQLNWVLMPINKTKQTKTLHSSVSTGSDNNWALVTVEEVHLRPGHYLQLVNQVEQLPFTSNTNLSTVPDSFVNISYPVIFTLNTVQFDWKSPESNRGFNLRLRYPGTAVNVTVSQPNQVITFTPADASKAINGTEKVVIWAISANNSSPLLSDVVLHFNVSLSEPLSKTKANLTVYDSISLRTQTVHYANGLLSDKVGYYVGSIKKAFIVYDYSQASVSSNISIQVTINAEKCSNTNYTLHKCLTVDRCITDPMVCNGIDECGDYSDEMHCDGNHPVPPPSPPNGNGGSSGGVSVLVVMFVLMPLSSALGILGYIYLPQFLLRIRRGRYSEFRDLSEVS